LHGQGGQKGVSRKGAKAAKKSLNYGVVSFKPEMILTQGPLCALCAFARENAV
jgi:hypothetical protein